MEWSCPRKAPLRISLRPRTLLGPVGQPLPREGSGPSMVLKWCANGSFRKRSLQCRVLPPSSVLIASQAICRGRVGLPLHQSKDSLCDPQAPFKSCPFILVHCSTPINTSRGWNGTCKRGFRAKGSMNILERPRTGTPEHAPKDTAHNAPMHKTSPTVHDHLHKPINPKPYTPRHDSTSYLGLRACRTSELGSEVGQPKAHDWSGLKKEPLQWTS